MAVLQSLMDAIGTAEESHDWNEVARLCRLGISAAPDAGSRDWYDLRIRLIRSLSKAAGACANDDVIPVCQEILANAALHEPARKVPIINMALADAYAATPSGTPQENLRRAILHYRAAYELINREEEPVLHASFAVQMGLAYLRLGQELSVPADEVNVSTALIREAITAFSQHGRYDLQVEAEWLLRRLSALIRDGVGFRAAWAMLCQGKASADRGESRAAFSAFTEAIRLDAERGEAYFRRGDLYAEAGDYVRAVADYSEVIRLEPDTTAAYINRGLAHSAQGNIEDAINDYSHAIRLSHDDAVGLYNRANAHRDRGDFEKAIADYSEALRLTPTLDAAYHNRGSTYQRLGRYDEAVADYTQAIGLNPVDARSVNSRGVTHKMKGDLQKAVADYTEAMRLDPAYAAPACNRGSAYLVTHEYQKAIADYGEAIRIDPTMVMAYYGRGQAYAQHGDMLRAIADFSKVIALQPTNADAFYERACAYADIGEELRAEEDFARVAELRRGVGNGRTGNESDENREREKRTF